MARKTKAQIEAESHAKEVSDTVADAARGLITKNYPHIVAAAQEHNSWTGAPVTLKFSVTSDGIVRDVKMSVPRKAMKDSFIPESPSDKIQDKMNFDDDNA